jgi:hypothetical protein
MEDFIEWVPAGDDLGKVATHTSFMDVNYALRRSGSDYIPTPDPGTTWYLLVGASEKGTDGAELEELAHSYSRPARIALHRDPGEPEELHRGRVLFEGYDFALRAYTIRKQGEDRVRLRMVPEVPQVNPVFLINGWSSPSVGVRIDGREAARGECYAQVHGHDLTIWIRGRFDRETGFEFLGREAMW